MSERERRARSAGLQQSVRVRGELTGGVDVRVRVRVEEHKADSEDDIDSTTVLIFPLRVDSHIQRRPYDRLDVVLVVSA